MQLKTSTKISLKFTLFATVILLIFSVVIFILFFGTRYSKQKERLHINKAYQPPMLLTTIISNVSPGEPQPLFTRNIKKDETTKNAIIISKNAVHLPLTNATPTEIPLEELSEKNGYYLFNFLSFISQGQITIFYKGGNYFTYTIQYDKVKFLDITGFMYAQMELTQLLLFRDICFIVIVYLLSLYFVKSSLKNLKRLTTYVQNLNIERPTVPLTVQGHKYDEIRVISDAFNSFTKKIHSQVQTLKDFIANASHELKTPLMMINTEIDIALKKQDYTDRLLTIKENIKRLSSLLDTLSLITRLENATTIEKESINLAEKTQTIVQEIERMYPKKNILIDIPAEITLQAHAGLIEIVLKNLLENACKYAGDKANISVIGTAHSLSVIDTGKGIAPEFQQQMFERFRQLEKTEKIGHSFGLGLYLVKTIVQLHKRKIQVESEKGKGCTITIQR